MPHKTLHSDIRKCALVRPLTRGGQAGNVGAHVKVPSPGCERNMEYIARKQSFMQRASLRSRDKRRNKGLQIDNQAVLYGTSLYAPGSHTDYIRYTI
jgi:hypothetical protein